MTSNQTTQTKQIIEAMLFTAENPLAIEDLIVLIPDRNLTKDAILAIITELQGDYSSRGIALTQVATGYRFQTRPELASALNTLHKPKQTKFSKAFLETLAVIAYQQPVTRADIEAIRGVSVNYQFFQTMLERNWIQVADYKEVPGRPARYATTPYFLNYFGLASLDELPSLESLGEAAWITTAGRHQRVVT
jgi:segregation and condensation protein B